MFISLHFCIKHYLKFKVCSKTKQNGKTQDLWIHWKKNWWKYNLLFHCQRDKWQLFLYSSKTIRIHNTDIFCLPVCLWLSASVFVSPSSEKLFVRSGTAALPWKSSVNWWSCCSESAAFKSTEHSPLRPSNAFTRISPIYKAYAHLQTHSPHPLKYNTGQNEG